MSRLSKDNKIYFIEPQRDYRLSFIKNLRNNYKTAFKISYRKEKNLIIVNSPPSLPLVGNMFSENTSNILAENIQKVNNYILGKYIKKLIKYFKLVKPIVFIYNPLHYEILLKLKDGLICYYVYDEVILYPQNKRIRKLLANCDNILTKKADIVFASSKPQFEKRKHLNKETYLIENAVDFNHFNKVMCNDFKVPMDIKDVKHPIIGYIGAIGFKIDVNILIHTAKMHPDWSLIFVGPEKLKRDNKYFILRKLNNVIFLGFKPLKLLPNYLKVFDVAIMPYDVKTHVTTSFPLKLYEYLSAGKPVVSVNLKSLNKLKDIVKVANSSTEFVSYIEEVIAEYSVKKVNKGIALARENTWDERIKEVSRVINNRLES
jgi:hypothetical protein